MDWKVFYQELGQRLKSVRKMAGFTQAEIGKQINISRQYTNQIEKGKAENVSLIVILNYLDTCKVDFLEFFGQLEKDISKREFEKVVSRIDLPKDYKLRKKVSRDIELYHTKIKGKIGKAKPLSKESQDKAVVKFGNYRTKIELVQSLAYKVIAKHAPSTTLNPFYRAFVNEVYKQIKKDFTSGASRFCGSHPYSLFENIIQKWIKRGLKQEILVEIKDVVVEYFKPGTLSE